MVLAKKQLSKVVAIVLVAMCAVAFMPMLNGEAFAAAKAQKPAKVVVKSAKQVNAKTMKVKVTWKKAKNAKKYNIKIDKKVVKKNVTKLTYTSGKLAAGTHKVYVQAVNGKKKGAWSKAKSFKITAPKVAVKDVTIDNATPEVGDTLTATIDPANATSPTYQWYRVPLYSSEYGDAQPKAIRGATKSTYTVTFEDTGYVLLCEVTAGGKTIASKETAAVQNTKVKSVEIVLPDNHTAPEVLDEIMANCTTMTGRTGDRAESYTWYLVDASGNVVYTDEPVGNTFTIPAKYDADRNGVPETSTVGCTVYVEAYQDVTATDGEDDLTLMATSTKVGPIVADSTSNTATIAGATMKYTDNDGDVEYCPAVGDTLTVEKDGADNGCTVTYQWMRGSMTIAGATGATYTVTADDLNGSLTCTVIINGGNDPIDSYKLLTVSTEKVGTSIEKYAMVVKTSADGTYNDATATTATTDDSLYAKVWNGNKAVENVTVFWFKNEVDIDFHDFKASDFAKSKNFVGETDANEAFPLNATTESGKPVFKAGDDAIAVAVGQIDGSQILVGVITATAVNVTEAIDFARITTDIGTIEEDSWVDGDATSTNTAAGLKANMTTLTAKAYIGETALTEGVTYQWYRSNGTTTEKIAGATSQTYQPTTVDAQDKDITEFSCVIKGDGDKYSGTWTATISQGTGTDFWAANVKQAPTISIVDADGNAVETVQPGDKLHAKVAEADAVSHLTFSWKTEHTDTGVTPAVTTTVDEQKGKAADYEYVVPAAAVNGDTITLSAKADENDKWSDPESATATVSKKIESLTISESGTTTYGTAADPEVGDTLKAAAKDATNNTVTSVNYQWYAGDEAIEDATYPELTVDAAFLGKTLKCEVTGTDDYAGAKKDASTNAVTAEATMTVSSSGQLDNEHPATVGDILTTTVETESGADITAQMTFTWEIGDTAPAAGLSEDGTRYAIQDNDAGKTIKVVAANEYVKNTLQWNMWGGTIAELD